MQLNTGAPYVVTYEAANLGTLRHEAKAKGSSNIRCQKDEEHEASTIGGHLCVDPDTD